MRCPRSAARGQTADWLTLARQTRRTRRPAASTTASSESRSSRIDARSSASPSTARSGTTKRVHQQELRVGEAEEGVDLHKRLAQDARERVIEEREPVIERERELGTPSVRGL
jgi:hypothetical protein